MLTPSLREKFLEQSGCFFSLEFFFGEEICGGLKRDLSLLCLVRLRSNLRDGCRQSARKGESQMMDAVETVVRYVGKTSLTIGEPPKDMETRSFQETLREGIDCCKAKQDR